MHITFLMQDTRSMYGAERATLDLLVGLACTKEVRVSVALISESRLGKSGSQVERAFREADITCYCLPTGKPFSWSLVHSIREHVQAHSVDCVHVVGYKSAVHGGLAMRFGRLRPWVSTVHGWLDRPNAKEQFYGWVEVQMLKRAQRVVVLSNFYHDRLTRKGILAERIAWIPSGLQLESLGVDFANKPFALAQSEPTIGILGRFSSEKNHGMFLQVAKKLLDEGFQGRFLVAGDGPDRRAIENLVDEMQLQSHVELAGVMDRSEFFRQVDLLVMCSRIENLPYTILEAMAWSRPVVATCVGGIPDLIEPGVTGLLVKDIDVDGMVCAIQQLCTNPSAAREMGTAGRNRLEQQFTLQRSVDAHLRMYRELVSG